MYKGDLEDALTTINDVFKFIEESGEHHFEAEIYRTQADILHGQGDHDSAELSLHKAIHIAKNQSAKSWELRASIDLARLLQEQGRIDEARNLLSEIYNWFTEGFNTHDLLQAQELLDQLSG